MVNSKKWQLEPKEVIKTWITVATSTAKRRNGRVLDRRNGSCTLTHRPTNIAVNGSIPEGNYSKGQMRDLKKEVESNLYKILEEKVAKHLRLPRR